MNVLITGGAGFIGSHLIEKLRQEPHTRITVLDDFSTGTRTVLGGAQHDGHVQLVTGSVTDGALLEPLVAGSDAVYHLAAAVGVRRVLERPVETLETNVLGTHLVLQLCARHGKPALLASSSEVYGKSTAVPFREDGDTTLGATATNRWGYACSKMLDEFLALAYAREAGLKVVCARLFNTVGPRQTGRYGMVIPTLVRQALANEPLTVHGDGTQTRCFTHVHDAVRALHALLNEPQAHGQVVNVGGQHEVSIGEVARRIIALAESRSELQFVPYERAFARDMGFEDMKRRVPDTSRLRVLVGFAPSTPLDNILRDVISYERAARA